MTTPRRFRPTLLTLALGLGSMAGCFGSGDDKGDNPGVGAGTGRPAPDAVDAAKTGGLGEIRDGHVPGPGETGPKTSAGDASGPK